MQRAFILTAALALTAAAQTPSSDSTPGRVTFRPPPTDDTNSIEVPTTLGPVTAPVDGLSADFTKTFLPYSITILEMNATNAR